MRIKGYFVKSINRMILSGIYIECIIKLRIKMEMEKIIQNSEMLSSVKWYFDIKNLSLKNALLLHCPLSLENQKDLRIYYSQYFSGLLSATELFLDENYPHRLEFKDTLYNGLSFKDFPNGKNNYSYLRELRNSIIHRGLDINSAVHIVNDFPMIIAPSPVTNRSKKSEYIAFDYYLINLIEKCESIIGTVFLNHIEEFGLFQIEIPQEEIIKMSKEFISNASAVPDWVKDMALSAVEKIDHSVIHQDFVNSLKETLKINILSH